MLIVDDGIGHVQLVGTVKFSLSNSRMGETKIAAVNG
jgi:hypothetical protein